MLFEDTGFYSAGTFYDAHWTGSEDELNWAAGWLYAGGAHHAVISTALDREDVAMFCRLTGTELITIGDDSTMSELAKLAFHS